MPTIAVQPLTAFLNLIEKLDMGQPANDLLNYYMMP